MNKFLNREQAILIGDCIDVVIELIFKLAVIAAAIKFVWWI
jgi:hypothetical protein